MIKFRHRNCNKTFQPATFCYDLPPGSLFQQLFLQGENLITFPFGMTLVHKNDNYNRATGRDYSFRDMKQTTFKLLSITIEDGKQFYTLENSLLQLIIKVSVNPNLCTSNLCWIEFNKFYF